MPFRRVVDISSFELLFGYLRIIRSHIEHLDERGGIIEEAVAATACDELSFALDDINAMRIGGALLAPRDAVGDVCYLLIELLQGAQRREALMETFEGVKDIALQQEDVNRIAVRVVDEEELARTNNYYWRARAIMKHPAEKLGLDSAALDDPAGMVL